MLLQAATGHGPFAYHLSRWRTNTDKCELCDFEATQTAIHIFRDCPALAQERLETNALSWKSQEDKIVHFFKNKKIQRGLRCNINMHVPLTEADMEAEEDNS